MASERYLKTIVYGAAVVWVAVMVANNQTLKSDWLGYLSTAMTVVSFGAVGFDLWFWKWPFLQGWFVKRPVIEGTWKVEIRSNWVDASTGSRIPPVEGYMVTRQTFSTLSLRLLTLESGSELVGTEIVCSADGLYCVSGVYRNEPRHELRDRSAIHYGAVWLKIMNEDSEKQIVGHYWTDRATSGEIQLTNLQHKRFQSFQAAQEFFRKLPATP